MPRSKRPEIKLRFSVLQNVSPKAWSRDALPQAKVVGLKASISCISALNSGRADAAPRIPRHRTYMKQNAGRYVDSGFSWNPQTYSCIVKQGDPDWLNFVNVALRESP